MFLSFSLFLHDVFRNTRKRLLLLCINSEGVRRNRELDASSCATKGDLRHRGGPQALDALKHLGFSLNKLQLLQFTNYEFEQRNIENPNQTTLSHRMKDTSSLARKTERDKGGPNSSRLPGGCSLRASLREERLRRQVLRERIKEVEGLAGGN